MAVQACCVLVLFTNFCQFSVLWIKKWSGIFKINEKTKHYAWEEQGNKKKYITSIYWIDLLFKIKQPILCICKLNKNSVESGV